MTIPFVISANPSDDQFNVNGKVRIMLNGQYLDVTPATARAIAVSLVVTAEKVTAPCDPEQPTKEKPTPPKPQRRLQSV